LTSAAKNRNTATIALTAVSLCESRETPCTVRVVRI